MYATIMIIQIVLFLFAQRNLVTTAYDIEYKQRLQNAQEAVKGKWVTESHIATPHLADIDDLPNVAYLNDAQHRGPKWYDDTSNSDSTDMASTSSGSQTDISSSVNHESDESTSASSFETSEKKLARRTYRECVACPRDMMKSYKNIGIKWICGGYQRARRTFKSECMMRYRNCEDGTLFVKISNHRCKDDSTHGHHWFYVYRT